MQRRKVISSAVALGLVAASPNDKPPELTARTLDGTSFSLAAQRGNVVLVNFWATWCVPCRVEMPALDSYYRRHRDDGFAMLAVGMDAGGPVKKLLKTTRPFSFPVARIDDVKIRRDLIPTGLPVTRIYDRAGALRYDSGTGKPAPLDDAALERIVTPLLRERGPNPD
jgi:thiol-disulfide isomerase/thioredoxin